MPSLEDLAALFQLITLLDLTSLNADDTTETIAQLCRNAQSSLGHVAAVCVYPQFVSTAKRLLENTNIHIATVANFPHGVDHLENCLALIHTAIAEGANEIDVVIPYRHLIAGEKNFVQDYLHACRTACPNPIIFKVIIESGELEKPELINTACEMAITAKADFIKTSTGKTKTGATPDAVRVILNALQKVPVHSIGIKISGGVRTVLQAREYLDMITVAMGVDWINPQHVRFGASQLLQEILNY